LNGWKEWKEWMGGWVVLVGWCNARFIWMRGWMHKPF
jgi:hypothetical protein